MFESFSPLTGATCASIAQILPLFFVALVAERVSVRKSRSDGSISDAAVLAVLVRIVVDLLMAFALLVLILLALQGVQKDGLPEERSQVLLIGTFILMCLVLYRWLLLSTPILLLARPLTTAMNEAAESVLNSFGSVLTWQKAFVSILFRLPGAIFVVLTLGMSSISVSVVDSVTRLLTPKDRGKSTEESE